MFTLEAARFILTSITDPVAIKKVDGIYIQCNQHFLEFTNLRTDKIAGCLDEDIFLSAPATVHRQASQYLTTTARIGRSRSMRYSISPQDTPPYSSGYTTNKATIISEDGSLFGFVMLLSTKDPKHAIAPKVEFGLTKQEDSVLLCLGQGLPVKVIAKNMNISIHTVSGHLKSIYLKMGVKSRSEAQRKLFLS